MRSGGFAAERGLTDDLWPPPFTVSVVIPSQANGELLPPPNLSIPHFRQIISNSASAISSKQRAYRQPLVFATPDREYFDTRRENETKDS